MKILNIDFGFGSNSMGFNDHALLNILELQKHGNDITWVTCDATPMVKNYIKSKIHNLIKEEKIKKSK